jgi:hypothetical protein
MVNEHVDTLRRAERFRSALPLISLHGFETVHERVVKDGAIHEIVVTPTVAETLRENADYADLFADLRECENFDAYVCDDEIPFYVGLIDDDGVEIGVDEDGTPRALLSTEAPTVRAWAEDVYERYRPGSEPTSSTRDPARRRRTAGPTSFGSNSGSTFRWRWSCRSPRRRAMSTGRSTPRRASRRQPTRRRSPKTETLPTRPTATRPTRTPTASRVDPRRAIGASPASTG